ncbi:MAG: type II toxin-antitoxin system PemK/MazF family toxin [Desulfobacterales bacterium]|nr:type II toxin-antitoxin system PemK/MazF family toxin [Desulfobacterales bacterium]
MNIKRGDIFLAALDPVVGKEISKTRPIVIISNDKNNEFAGTVTILSVTGRIGKVYPFEVFLPKGTANLSADSKVKANQVRTLDKSRIVRFIGRLEADKIYQIENAVKIHLGLK